MNPNEGMERQDKPIQYYLETLEKDVSELKKIVDTLEQRLIMVILSQPDTTKNIEDKSGSPLVYQSPLAQRIQGVDESIRIIGMSLEGLLRHLNL